MQELKLDLSIKKGIDLVYAKQRDVGSKICIKLTDNEVDYVVPDDVTWSVWYSGVGFEGNYDKIDDRDAVVVNGSTATVELIYQMLDNPGPGEMCLVMNSADGTQLGLWNIPYFVEALPGADSKAATVYYQAFLQAREGAEDAAAKSEAAAGRSEAAAEDAQEAAKEAANKKPQDLKVTATFDTVVSDTISTGTAGVSAYDVATAISKGATVTLIDDDNRVYKYCGYRLEPNYSNAFFEAQEIDVKGITTYTATINNEGQASRTKYTREYGVLYTPQTLTPEQQAQARENIGAVGHSDLEVKAECNATSLSVTQESNYGVSNDKIVQLDGLEAVVVNANNNNVCFSIEYYGNRFYVYGANSLNVNNNDVLLLYTSEDVEAKSRKYDIVFEAKDYKYLICTTAYNCAEYNIAKINAYTYPDALTINGNEVSRPKDISDAIYSHSDDAHIYKESAKLDSMTTSTQVISAFDALMNDHPNYITKNDLGADSAGNRIFEYVFGNGKKNDYAGHKRPMDSSDDKPVILLLSGVHGYERSCVMGTYLFAKALAEKKIFAKLRNKYIVKIIPLSVPSAYNLNTYENSNGVNIDCNFDANWMKEEGVHPNGNAPADQLETQILQAWMNNNLDALVMINYHNSGYTEEISYMSGDSSHLTTETFKEKFFDAMYRIEDYLKQTYEKDNAFYAYTGHYTLPTGYNYANKVGLVGLLLEASWNVTNNGTNNDAISNKANAEILGNLMLECFD